MNKVLLVIGATVSAIALIAVICLFTAFLTKWLFNGLAQDFAIPYTLTYWQAFKLNWLCGLLFKSSSSSK